MPEPKIAVVSVINDLVTDKRVDRTCKTLVKMGFNVLLVGRRKADSPSLKTRNYHTYRMNLLFEKGPLFYAEFNIRLFFFLLGQKAGLLFANDLDTLLPNFLVHKIRRLPLVYDSHEYFTGVPELIHRPAVQKIWKIIEKLIFPRLQDIITVNHSIAGLYKNEYHKDLHVVRNIPEKPVFKELKTRAELDLPDQQSIIIFQGAGINIDRGGEELVQAMKYLDQVLLLIVGGGDVIGKLQILTRDNRLESKIRFLPRQSFENLYHFTRNADLGLSIDKDTNINYRYSLPNKIFDYIHAGTPILASRLPEISQIVDEYGVGEYIDSHNPEHIALRIKAMLNDREKLEQYRQNCRLAARELNWEQEEAVLISILGKYA